ncbi:MAG: NAD-dependent epimerase/dehydratase family protein [Hymenobacteraceae bacterium]|nr:NAD-dependent epimerase/dehydratase family protein [Hymenobacteraceae bacterium]
MQELSQNLLVLGATGSIGYAFTKVLLEQRQTITILVRDRRKAEQLFGTHANLTIVEGDAQDTELLTRLGKQVTHIFHGINYPYDKWQGNMELVTQHVIDAAAANRATILFPGNVYNYGNIETPIKEDSPMNPNTRKGTIRVRLEQMLQQATKQGLCRVIIVRLPDFWGPNVMNEGIAPIFRGALKGEAMPWLYRNDIPHQLVYTPDAARVFYELVKIKPENPFAVYNYGGKVVPSIKSWQAQIAAAAGVKPRYKLHGKFLFKTLGLFMPIMREIAEMGYLWENAILLNDEKLRHTLPQLAHTPMPQAIQETLDWFREVKG